jgi:hypothetical protein
VSGDVVRDDLQTFRDAQQQRLAAIREIANVDALSAFQLAVSWIDQIARHYNGSRNGEANWRAFIRRFFPSEYHPETEIKRLYAGLRGPLLHELGTRGVLLNEDSPQAHLSDVGDLRVMNLPTFLNDCEAAWQAFSSEMDTDDTLRAAVVSRAPGIIQPVRLTTGTAAIAASASATSVDLEALGWSWPPRDTG